MTRTLTAATSSLIAIVGIEHAWLFGVDTSVLVLGLLSVALAGVVALVRLA